MSSQSLEEVWQVVHAVDFAVTGKDAFSGVHFTAYKDRSKLAFEVVKILPALTRERFGDEALNQWFFTTAMTECSDVTFEFDEDGNWK